MADVTTYKRCIHPFIYQGRTFTVGMCLPATDPGVANQPQWWVTLSDADFTSGKKGVHDA